MLFESVKMACFCFAISLHSRRPRLLDACMTTQQAVNQQSHEYWSQSCCRNNFGPSWTCHSQLIVQHFPVQHRGIALDSAFDKTKQLHVASLIRERERERERGSAFIQCQCKVFVIVLPFFPPSFVMKLSTQVEST